jgi:hypothetical protein
MTAKGDVPHDDFKSGFLVGFQAIRGTTVATPAVPAKPATKANMTPFLMGVRKGIERAGIELE